MTFNIKDGGTGREQVILEVFRIIQPELILLQEVTDPSLVREWAASLNMEFVVAKGHSFRHVAIMSYFPIVSWTSHTPLQYFSRDYLAATIEYAPAHSLRVFGIHLIAQPFVAYEWLRLLEIRSILRHAAQDSDLPCLLGGDFNAVSPIDRPIIKNMPLRIKMMMILQANRFPHAVIATTQYAQFFDCFRLLHTEPGFTLPPPAPSIRFDYLFANSHLKPSLQRCFVVREPQAVEYASDHYPLVADFAL